jgi:hypothetical protein
MPQVWHPILDRCLNTLALAVHQLGGGAGISRICHLLRLQILGPCTVAGI